MEMENKEGRKDLKSKTALRCCAKAALLLHRLKSLHAATTNNCVAEPETLRREIHDLKIELLKERFKSYKIKLCSLLELLLQLLLLLSLWTIFLLFFLRAS